MNDMAEHGWEYQRSDTLPSEERSGFTRRVTVWRNLLVFRRAVEEPEAEPEAPPVMLEAPKPVGVSAPDPEPAPEPEPEPAPEPEPQPEPDPEPEEPKAAEPEHVAEDVEEEFDAAAAQDAADQDALAELEAAERARDEERERARDAARLAERPDRARARAAREVLSDNGVEDVEPVNSLPGALRARAARLKPKP
ncbi:hypothetical protein [Pseudoponticoccus marisrubri]|uniref:hypothetical protein n=1 Tax=Pseudoponticoccus marisrubri TaxID=1685382 RepID=UPI000ACAA695|nr:hypothetical protein [Pseudoponticoccus marisrubri]